MELEQHSVTNLSLHLGPTLMRCPVALSGDADGFSHADQHATSALFPSLTCLNLTTHAYKNLGPFRPFLSILKWDNSTKKKKKKVA